MKINTPTKITLIRVAIIPFMMWMILITKENTLLGTLSLALFIGGSFTDWLDGYLARKYDQVTNFGKFIDQLADKAFISGIMCVLVWNQRVSFWLLALIIIRDTAVSGARMLAASKGEVIAANIFGKIKTALQMVYLGTVLFSIAYKWPNPTILSMFAWIVAIITIISGITYFKNFKRYL